MTWYINAVTSHPILTAIVQFAILGSLGEAIAKMIINKKCYWPFSFQSTVWKMIVWSILAVAIKYAFTGMKGYIITLVEHNFLPDLCLENKLLHAFTTSFFVNIQFGFFMVIFHRFLDNLVETTKNWKGLDKGMLCMIWFWIPAHTITFSLPKEFQIGLAALWSVVLGVLLGYFNKSKN